MTRFLAQLQAGIARCGLRDRHVLLAVSGGPDSVAMLRGMHALAGDAGLHLTAAHLNHQLRGEASAADAAWLESLCGTLGVRLVVDSRDIAAYARGAGMGIEEAARAARYAFLERVARAENCTHVSVAHTVDDQAVTILHHILRGTGLEGLRGMSPLRPLIDASGPVETPLPYREGPGDFGELSRAEGQGAQVLHDIPNVYLVRPLLEIPRFDVDVYLHSIGQSTRVDESNLDERFTRNRLRLSLLPYLEREFNPNVSDALRQLGRQAGDVQELIHTLARELLDRAVIDRNPRAVRIDCEQIATAPRHLVREALRLLWRELAWPRQKMGFAEWDRLADLAVTPGTATLPGAIEATRRGKLLILRTA